MNNIVKDNRINRREFLKRIGLLLGGSALGPLFTGSCAQSGETGTFTLTETVTVPFSGETPTEKVKTTAKKPKTTASMSPNPEPSASATSISGSGSVLLGRPEGNSITLNALFPRDVELYVEYGPSPEKSSAKTGISLLKAAVPLEITLEGLATNTRYYYQLRYRVAGSSAFQEGIAGKFHTQRATGESFVFTIDADPHFDKNSDPEEIKTAFRGILSQDPDFNIDLGDTFMTEKLSGPDYEQIAAVYRDRRDYFALFGHSVPLFLVLGNHDGETGWLRNGTENNVAVWASRARKLYYSNPGPDNFYSGNTAEEKYIGVPQDYYAWEWGNALFVAIDPYWYTPVGGENGDFWDRTIGTGQYLWLKSVLEKSTARFKFIFTHHVLGNCRGGVEWCDYFEMGGRNKNGTWEFDNMRPGWETPLHQLFVKNGVTIVFQGHDHLYVRQEKDGVIYQEVPQPSMAPGMNGAANDDNYKSGITYPSPGYLRVNVDGNNVKVDYLHSALPGDVSDRRKNGEVVYSYSVR